MPVGEFEWDDAVGVGIAIVAGLAFAIALRAWLRTRTTRVGLFAAAFGCLFGKGLVKAVEVLFIGDSPALDAIELTLDALVVLLFFLGMTRT